LQEGFFKFQVKFKEIFHRQRFLDSFFQFLLISGGML